MERGSESILLDSDYVTVRVERQRELVLVERKDVPFHILQDFVATADEILSVVQKANATDYGLLYDTRHGPAPGGTTYMKAFTRMAEELALRFRRVAAVVATSETLEEVRKYAPSKVQFFINPTAARAALDQMARE